jgi:integrase/recombinase XerD
LRDRALLELTYACGLRASESVGLKLNQIDMKVGYLRILGKGNKERVVPVGKVAIEWLGNYLKSGRPKLLGKKASYFVFVGRAGKPITRQRFWQLFKAYSISAGIKSEVSPRAPPFLCNASPGRWSGSEGRADASRPQQYQHYPDIHTS